jgi:hypothetical protein
MSKTFLLIIIVAIIFTLPILSGKAAAIPKSLEPTLLAEWLSRIANYWIDLAKEFIKQLKL